MNRAQHGYYAPNSGRWLTRDPIGHAGGINLYSYCQNNPVMHADPSGLVSCAAHGPGSGGFDPDTQDGGGDYGGGSYDDEGVGCGARKFAGS